MNKTIIHQLIIGAHPFMEITRFCDKPGIYAIFFYGNLFPLEGVAIKSNQIIYLGKTESSQQSRDADTHFSSAKTGSSTVRRSLGALLKKELNLNPIPRNDKDFGAGRFTVFKFDNSSEVKLTSWMQKNLGLSFFMYDKPKDEINKLETELIDMVRPILNIDFKNPHNPYASIIKAERRLVALDSYKR